MTSSSKATSRSSGRPFVRLTRASSQGRPLLETTWMSPGSRSTDGAKARSSRTGTTAWKSRRSWPSDCSLRRIGSSLGLSQSLASIRTASALADKWRPTSSARYPVDSRRDAAHNERSVIRRKHSGKERRTAFPAWVGVPPEHSGRWSDDPVRERRPGGADAGRRCCWGCYTARHRGEAKDWPSGAATTASVPGMSQWLGLPEIGISPLRFGVRSVYCAP